MRERENTKKSNEHYVRISKLLAAENIQVQFSPSASTASFNLETRTMVLPVFENISNDIYGMLVSHEIGHTLYTPLDKWQQFVESNGASGAKVRASYANVIEDSRIEKLIKRRFPGVVKEMVEGYSVLHNNNFFGVADKNIADLRLIDRINLHYKSYGHLEVPFNEEEQAWLSRIDSCETFRDVINTTRALLDYEKEKLQEQEETQEEQNEEQTSNESNDTEESPSDTGEGAGDDSEDDSKESGDDSEESGDDSEESGAGEETDADSEGAETGKSSYSDDDLLNEGEEKESAGADDSEESTDGQNSKASNGADDSESDSTIEASETDSAMSQSMEQAAASGSGASNSLITIDSDYFSDKENFNKHFVPAADYYNIDVMKRVYENHAKLYEYSLKEFRIANRKYVSALSREFEMKKAASRYKRAQTSKSGRLDMKKLHTYRFNDDLFLRNTVLPEGKNHGVVMLVDLSGSMSNIIRQTMAQVLNMSLFCDQASIPYQVLGFTNDSFCGNNIPSKQIDYHDAATPKNNSCAYTKFHLVELIASNNSKAVKRQAQEMLAFSGLEFDTLHKVYSHFPNPGSYSISSGAISVYSFLLGGTPLLGALAMIPEVIRRFQSTNPVEKTVFVTYTDGGAGDYVTVPNGGSALRLMAEVERYLSYHKIQTIYDRNSRVFYDLSDSTGNKSNMFGRLQEIYTDRIRRLTGATVLGFHILSSDRGDKLGSRAFSYTIHRNQKYAATNNCAIIAKFEENGVHTMNEESGYDAFTLVRKDVLSTSESTIEQNISGRKSIEEASTAAIGRAFVKSGSSSKRQKFLVRDLIAVIA